MSIHVCKQCGLRFEYCRMCVFRPVRYKDNGFCSKECYEASKNVVVPVIEIEPVKEEVLIEDVEMINEEISIEVETETVDLSPVEDSIETTIPIVKNETNTYKKKKNKYRVHE